MKYFYEEITQLTIITNDFFDKKANKKEVAEIIEIAKSTVHHKVIDHILSELDDQTKEEFIHLLEKNDSHKQNLEELKKHIKDLEEKVIDVVRKAEKEIHNIIIASTS